MQKAPDTRPVGARALSSNLLPRAVVCLLSAGAQTFFAASAGAQTAPADQPAQTLQEVVVTGSLIKRTNTETPSPVQVISQQDLQNSGFNSVSDVLLNLASNGQGTLNQGFGQAFASGGSGIALRGLTVGDTLTLIDSKRMIAYPLSDDGQRSFVDISAIPFDAVESIEILKDGASALYGADAIAGVVNVKLRETYVGTQVTAEYGATQHWDGNTLRLAAITGWGDLANDGYNVYATLDWRRQQLIWGTSRSGPWTNLDWSGYPGGLNTNGGAIGAQNLTYPDSVTGYLLNPTTPNAAGVYPNGLPAEEFLPGCTAALQAANKCLFTFPGQIQPPTEQTNFLAKLTKAFASDWKLIVTASLFDSAAQQTAPPTEPVFGHLLQNTGAEAGSLPLVAWEPGSNPTLKIYPALSLPANSPLNPYGTGPLGAAATLVYSFPDIGPWVTNTDTKTYRLFGEVRGSAGGWDLDGYVGLMYARMSYTFDGGLVPAAAQAALNDGSYVPGAGAAANANALASMAPQASSAPSSTLDIADFHGTHELFQMPGGALTLVAGAQYFHKAQNDTAPPSILAGTQEGVTNFTVGSQDVTAGFLELGGKVFPQLEANAAVRYDHYDTYGGQATPKFGLKYTPVETFTLRGTWGKGFRAPSISEAGDSGTVFGLGNTYDAVLCPNGKTNVAGTYNQYCSYPLTGISPSNPALKAVTSTNATFGVIFEPSRAFNVSVDWYRIQLNNDIVNASATGALTQTFSSLERGPQAVLPVCINTTTNGTPCTTANVLTPVGTPAFLVFPYLNAATTKTSGIDVDLRSYLSFDQVGKFTFSLNYTYISQYEITAAGQTFYVDGTHGPSSISGDTGNPKQRAVASLTWEQGRATATLSANYTGSFRITDPTSGYNTCLEAIQLSGVGYGPAISPSVTTLAPEWNPYCSVHSFTSFNLFGQYAVTDRLSVHGSVRNLFNTPPSVDLQTYGGGAMYRYTTLQQDGAVGRFFLLGATYTF
jgi:iron complex outermembrane recepter protein